MIASKKTGYCRAVTVLFDPDTGEGSVSQRLRKKSRHYAEWKVDQKAYKLYTIKEENHG